MKRRNIEFCVRKRESARERESRNTQINATQRTAAKSDPPEPFSGEVSTLLLSTRQCVDTAHCVVRPNYNQDQGAQGESRFRLGPWTKGQKDKRTKCLYIRYDWDDMPSRIEFQCNSYPLRLRLRCNRTCILLRFGIFLLLFVLFVPRSGQR